MKKRQCIKQWVLWKLDSSGKSTKFESSFTPYTKISWKWCKDLKIRCATIKLLEENIGKTFSNINRSKNFLSQSPKAKETEAKIEMKLPTSAESWKKQESSRKTSISALLTMPKPLTVWITINCGKFWKRWEYQTTWSASWEICMQVRKQQLELDMEQHTASK